MSRDPLTRMDVDTFWPYNDRWRRLRREYPTTWPHYFAGYMALLGEAWKRLDRRQTLENAWLPEIPVSVDEAAAALVAVGLLDKWHRVTLSAWKEWVEPAMERIQRRSQAGRVAAEKRWSDRGGRKAKGMRSQCTTPTTPTTPKKQAKKPRRIANGTPADASPTTSRRSSTPRVWTKLGEELKAMAKSSEQPTEPV